MVACDQVDTLGREGGIDMGLVGGRNQKNTRGFLLHLDPLISVILRHVPSS